MINNILLGIAILTLVLFIALAIMSIASWKITARSPQNGKLAPCPDKPNCLCSEYQGEHYINPVDISSDGFDISAYVTVIKEMNGKPVTYDDEYLHATFTTPIMRYVDDFELRIDKNNRLLHIRSASRVGYSDLGKNRKRINEFKKRLESKSRNL